MIGSHDSFTYLKSTNWFYNRFTRVWKTQDIDIITQYALGVRMFDIRVRRDNGCWRVCHGICDLKMTFPNLESICTYMQEYCPEAIYRIVLEKGSDRVFKIEACSCKMLNPKSVCNVGLAAEVNNYITCNLTQKYPKLWRVDIKSTGCWTGTVCNNNQDLYDEGYKFALSNTWEEPAYELHGIVTSKNFYKINLKKEADKINKDLKDKYSYHDLYESKDKLFLIDYVF